MRWSLKANKKVGKGSNEMTFREWVKQLEADGHDTTGMLDDEPEIFQDLIVYWNAFHILSSSRSSGFGIGAIPLSAYESYFRIFDVDSLEEQLDYLRFVGVLDSEYLKYQEEQREEEQKKNKQSSRTPKPRTGKRQAIPPRR